jgi:uncharacterized protein (DUF58 family)
MPADLIPHELRARLRDLRLVARRNAGGDGLGQHSSRSRGAGLEFAQYRAYEPGDEPRRIDWKLYARSDRYFVREAERDSPLSACLLLDATASMRQADHADPSRAKFDVAKTLAACVIELALRQGDRFGIVLIGDGVPWVIPAGTGARQRDRCLLELARRHAAGAWPGEDALRPLWERIEPSSLVVFMSDFFDAATVALAERLSLAGRDVSTIQLLGADERDFPFTGAHRFVDPESTMQRRVDAAGVRKEYLERFAAARARLARRFAARGIRHVEHVLDQPPDAPLRALFGSNPSPAGRTARAGARTEHVAGAQRAPAEEGE